jgi:hypothetical protein
MAKRKTSAKPSPAQAQASMENFCLRALAGLDACFTKAGHHDFAMLAQDLDAKFRAKLKGYK